MTNGQRYRRPWQPTIGLMLCLLAGSLAGQEPAVPAAASAAEDAAEFFTRQVRPILVANCIPCHGAEKKIQSGLNLTTREGLLKGGENGPAVLLDKPEESPLLAAIRYEAFEMPPKGKLPQAQIEVLTRWVKMGMPWPKGAAGQLIHHGPPVVDDAARNFWSFRPVVRPPVPAVQHAAWVRNPIDAFVLAKLESKGLHPAPPARPEALLRRVHYTLTGLPPAPEEVEAFVREIARTEGEGESGRAGDGKGQGEAAFERAYAAVVDRLLASRHYGEHWGRHWLDLVRYAETNSFERDNPKPFVWRYRDYVIRSLNADKPYDQFIREQLAGDELDTVTAETIIATGYYRLGLWDDEPVDPVMAYYDGLDDIVATTGQTFLGLTVNCGRCHDHKIDPFPQRDYYRLLAFFHGIRHYGQRSEASVAAASLRSIATPAEEADHREALAAYRDRLAQLEAQLQAVEAPLTAKLPGGERDDFQYPRNRVAILKKHIGQLLSQEEFDAYARQRRELERLERNPPRSAALALCVTEELPPRETFVLLRGNPQSRGERVEPGFPAVLSSAGSGVAAAANAATPDATGVPRADDAPSGPTDEATSAPNRPATSGRRRVLAEWIASPENPLTARVMANRVWQYHFGRGIVRSASDFGYQGTPPTHPELLDWLASEFVAGGWSLKRLHRLILMSNTYRQASSSADFKLQMADSPQSGGAAHVQSAISSLQSIDPENDLFSHFDLRRLAAEEIRDSILAVCGNLNLARHEGPSVYPPIPAEVLAGQSRPGYGWPTSGPEDAAARSVFVHVKRSLALPILAAFDAPDPDAPCPVRFTTTQPTQALGMLNSEFLNSQAALFASRARQAAGTDAVRQVRYVLWRVLQREPTVGEIDRGVQFVAATQREDRATAEEALRRFCLVALNLNEFVYLE